jgi:OmpA-OmpF porin, OOP family
MTLRRLCLALAAVALLGACSAQNRVVLLDSGRPSTVTITNDAGVTTLDHPGEAVEISSRSRAPKPVELTQADVNKEWRDAIALHPQAPVTWILYFVLDTTRLTTASRGELPQVLDLIKRRPVPEVSVVGYTDRSGAQDYNYQLALRRAQTVRREIEAIGVPHDAITVDSFGAANPLVVTKNPYEPRNRRVEMTVR